jgi:hypothetical protein
MAEYLGMLVGTLMSGHLKMELAIIPVPDVGVDVVDVVAVAVVLPAGHEGTERLQKNHRRRQLHPP